MKKFILGLGCGAVIVCSSSAFAAGSIQALLFPAGFEINGSDIELNKDLKVLNVEGRAYVPIRFIAEHLGATIDYDEQSQKIIIKNRDLDLTDPDYKNISVGNLILTKAGDKTKVTGQLQMEGAGNSKNTIRATLSFYDANNKKTGEVVISGTDFGVDPQPFVSEGPGDFRAFSTAILHIVAVNNTVGEAQSLLFQSAKHHFSLKLPKSWEGKYEVIEDTDSIHFISKANNNIPKEQGFTGLLFTIRIWSKEQWARQEEEVKGLIRIGKVGERGNEIFTLNTPSDVQYDPNNEKLTAQYISMSDYINTIKTSFKIID